MTALFISSSDSNVNTNNRSLKARLGEKLPEDADPRGPAFFDTPYRGPPWFRRIAPELQCA